jgi:Fic family protein
MQTNRVKTGQHEKNSRRNWGRDHSYAGTNSGPRAARKRLTRQTSLCPNDRQRHRGFFDGRIFQSGAFCMFGVRVASLDGFEGKLTSSKWAKLTKSSQDTAQRDITYLIQRGILLRSEEGGRSTSYKLARC